MKKIIITMILLVLIGLSAYFYFSKGVKIEIIKNVKKVVINNEKEIFSEEDIKIKKDKLDETKELEKKYEGIAEDVEAPKLYEAILTGEILDFKEKKYPKLSLNLEDKSGFYRVRILLFYHKDFIGYIQENINSKNKNLKRDFYFDDEIVLEGYKTLKNFEGGEISYRVVIWDNNLNIININSEKNIKIVDNTKPRVPEIYWTYYYSTDDDIEMYNNRKKNEFLIYPVPDMPFLEENKVVKYQYGVKDETGKLLFRAGVDKIEKEKKRVTLEIDKDGKYKFFTKTIDKNGNEADKEIRFNIDMTPPTGEIKIAEGVEHYIGEDMELYLEAKDNLSGLFRYRLGKSKEDLEGSNWEEYKRRVKYKASREEGIFTIWCQFQDNAFNLSKAISINYFAKDRNSMIIEARDGDKQKIIELDRRQMERGHIEIKKIEEK